MSSREDLYSVVDREAKDDAERRDSRVLVDALHSRRDQLDGASQIPAKDAKLSEQILGEARKRSAQISASRQASISQALSTKRVAARSATAYRVERGRRSLSPRSRWRGYCSSQPASSRGVWRGSWQ